MNISLTLLLTKAATIFLGVVGIGFLVGIHELGHWLFCKAFNVATPSFSIGFGPRLFTKKIGDTEFSLSALPLGGYVEIAGMQEVGQGEQAHAHDTSKSSFAVKPYYQKMIILLAGIAVNITFACIALTLLFMFHGIPEHAAFSSLIGTRTIKTVAPGSAAEKAGIQPGWEIIAISNKTNNGGLSGEDFLHGTEIHRLSQFLNKNLGKEINIAYRTPEDRKELETPNFLNLQVPCDSPQLGVTFALEGRPAYGCSLSGLWNAKIDAAKVIYSWMCGTFRSLSAMFTERHMKGLGGPLAIIHSITTSAQSGWVTFLIALCFISVGIACLNLVPLPIFDGGQVVFYTIESLAGRSLESMRLIIHYISWFLIMGLILLLTWRDIARIFFG